MSEEQNKDDARLTVGKGLRERITSGLIVWLLVTICIQPILSFTWKAIVVVGGLVHQGYVDRIYKDAAIIGTNPYGRLTLGILILALLLVLLFWLERVGESGPSSPLGPLVPIKVQRIISRGLAVAAFLVIFVRFVILQGTMKIDESFTQRLTVLAPAISDTEYKTLKARWAGMQGKADYDALVATMDKRAAELGVKLPPVRKP